MKKYIKIFIGIVVGLICVLIFLSVIGTNMANKENKLATSIIKNVISVSKTIEEYAEMSKEGRDSLCLEKHIEITGEVDEFSNTYILLNTDGFDVKCYVDDAKTQGIDENVVVTLDGACTYNASDNMRLRLCTVTNVDRNLAKESETEERVEEGNSLSEESATKSGDPNLEIVNELMENHNEKRKIESIECAQDGLIEKENGWKVFSVHNISCSLYGCSSELVAREEQLKNRLGTTSDTGVAVYLEDEKLPEYYVDLEAKQLYKTYLISSKDGTETYWLLSSDDVTLKEDLCEFYYDVIDEYRQQLNQYEYEVNGNVVVRNQKNRYVIIYGTARNAINEQFEGYIRIDYRDDNEINFSSESISVTAYHLMPDNSRSWEYDGQSALLLDTDNVYKIMSEDVINTEKTVMIFSPNKEWQ